MDNGGMDGRPVDPTLLTSFVTDVLMRCGLAEEVADVVATSLVRADLRGYETHGVARLLSYVHKLKSGEVSAVTSVECELSGDGTLCVAAGNSLGQYVGHRVVAEAANHLEAKASLICVIRDTGHLGALGMYVLDAAERGLIALLIQSTLPVMAAPGGRRPAIGHNPIAFSCPVAGRAPIVVDMSCGVAARGYILAAEREGRSIPSGWAMDADGEPTTDPSRALVGSLLPMSGHKGLGLAVIGQCLAGLLSGSDYATPLTAPSAVGGAHGHAGAFALFINPVRVSGEDDFGVRVAEWASFYYRLAAPNGRLPGDRAHALEQERRAHGVPLSLAVRDQLEAASRLAGAAPSSTGLTGL